MTQEPKNPKMSGDWSKDKFPTSARPIFKRVFQLIALIIVLCFFAYYVSEHPTDDAQELKREQLKEKLLTPEQGGADEYLEGEPFQGRSDEVPITQHLKRDIEQQQRELEREIN